MRLAAFDDLSHSALRATSVTAHHPHILTTYGFEATIGSFR